MVEVDPCAALDPVPTRTVVRLLTALVLLATTIGPLGLLVSGTLCGTLAASAVTGIAPARRARGRGRDDGARRRRLRRPDRPAPAAPAGRPAMTGADIAAGLAAALTVEHLAYAFAGAFLGTLVGVLPGLGPVATIALLLPTTFWLPPTGSLIMLAASITARSTAPSTTAILLNVPGEASGAVTAVSGHKMAREGRAVEALAVATLASAVAGLLSGARARRRDAGAGAGLARRRTRPTSRR